MSHGHSWLLIFCILVVKTSGVESSLNCSSNEVESDCHSACTEKKCPTANPVMINCLLLCQKGCACKEGFVRNEQGQCVEESACPPVANSTESPCNLVDCRSGTECVVRNGKAVCVAPPTESSITCANVRCGTRGGCVMVESAGCIGRHCRSYPSCVDVNSCLKKQCKEFEECVHVQVNCIMAPCPPLAMCRSKIRPLTWPKPESTRTTRQSGASCMTARCGTPAGCAMVKPSNCGESENCPLRPMCIHENACASTSCLVGSECVLHEVTCIKAPCHPIAKCEEPVKTDSCPKNEVFSDCVTACSDSKCNEEPKMCAQVCSREGCICKEGFFRNSSGSCVTQNDCDAESKKSC